MKPKPKFWKGPMWPNPGPFRNFRHSYFSSGHFAWRSQHQTEPGAGAQSRSVERSSTLEGQIVRFFFWIWQKTVFIFATEHQEHDKDGLHVCDWSDMTNTDPDARHTDADFVMRHLRYPPASLQQVPCFVWKYLRVKRARIQPHSRHHV